MTQEGGLPKAIFMTFGYLTPGSGAGLLLRRTPKRKSTFEAYPALSVPVHCNRLLDLSSLHLGDGILRIVARNRSLFLNISCTETSLPRLNH